MIVIDSITHVEPAHRGCVVLAGSHGGAYCAGVAAQAGLGAVLLNDAGFGLDRAGVGALALLDRIGMAAAAIGHMSARIGDGADMARRGVLSAVNDAARRAGCRIGMGAAAAAAVLADAPEPSGTLPSPEEVRMLLAPGVVGLDSLSLLQASDGNKVVVSGSHGALLRGNPGYVIHHVVRAVVCHDAGIGCDRAGISRLEPCAAMGVPAAAVDGATARVGDARSLWRTGRLSAVNRLARAAGAAAGMALPEFTELFA
ncbi:MAG: hypothetical protein OXF26_07725 [Alphaproteobacteria bacterium]|nr:hypothetical protein [Alphaproteobacteria bacterium]MCY4320449.1 hypothetical protein [Alphaproteobacteria bacterium]